jgi:hypothetical protein
VSSGTHGELGATLADWDATPLTVEGHAYIQPGSCARPGKLSGCVQSRACSAGATRALRRLWALVQEHAVSELERRRVASPRGDALVPTLDDGSTREVEHLLLATGYQIDLARYSFLAPEVISRVRTRNGSPVLGAGFESSVRGLHFLGAPAARSFGPVMRFGCGTWAWTRGLTRAVVGRAPRGGFSW